MTRPVPLFGLPPPQVCKGWRSLREEPELWASVDTTGGRGSGTIMSEGGIMRLLAPKIDRLAVVPSKEAVKSIVISGGKARGE